MRAMDGWLSRSGRWARADPTSCSTPARLDRVTAFTAAVEELRQVRKTRFGDWSDADIAYTIQTILSETSPP